MFEVMLDAIPLIRQVRGSAHRRPTKLHANKGYDYPHCHRGLGRRRIKYRIARRGKESRECLERHGWIVEHTLSWLNRFRRLNVHYERRAASHQAFLLPHLLAGRPAVLLGTVNA